jgi:hypothetical protein
MSINILYVMMAIVAFGLTMQLIAMWLAYRFDRSQHDEQPSVRDFIKHKRYDIGE